MSERPAALPAAPVAAAPAPALAGIPALRRTRVFVVDDSLVARRMLTRMLGADPEIEVVGTTSDPTEVVARVGECRPNVVTLDVEMPRVNGLEVLRQLMRRTPVPVVMVSAHTRGHAGVTLEALEEGAIDYVCKPDAVSAESRDGFARDLLAKVKTAARARVRTPAGVVAPAGVRVTPEPSFTATVVLPAPAARASRTEREPIIAIGASTGGTEAIRRVLQSLPPESPGIVVVQHIPPAFAASFASRLDACVPLSVRVAASGNVVRRGCVYVAPGDRHLLVERQGSVYACRLSEAAPVNRHRPSVDVLFRSLAQAAGRDGIGALLTGMGEDGARGLLEMRQAGSATLAQDEATSVVWGMPGEATRRGAACEVVSLDQIPERLLAASRRVH